MLSYKETSSTYVTDPCKQEVLWDVILPLYSHTVKDGNSLPKTLLAADRLKAFKAGVVRDKHHLLSSIPFKIEFYGIQG